VLSFIVVKLIYYKVLYGICLILMGRVILSIDSFSEIKEHSFILKQDKWIKNEFCIYSNKCPGPNDNRILCCSSKLTMNTILIHETLIWWLDIMSIMFYTDNVYCTAWLISPDLQVTILMFHGSKWCSWLTYWNNKVFYCHWPSTSDIKTLVCSKYLRKIYSVSVTVRLINIAWLVLVCGPVTDNEQQSMYTSNRQLYHHCLILIGLVSTDMPNIDGSFYQSILFLR
jgi:hypothetical protein